MATFLGDKDELLKMYGKRVLVPTDIKYTSEGKPVSIPRMKDWYFCVGYVCRDEKKFVTEDIVIIDDLEELAEACKEKERDDNMIILRFYFGKKTINPEL